MRMRILPVGVILALLASGCDVKVGEKGDLSVDLVEGRASDEWVRSYTLPKDGQLEIANSVGSIAVFPSAGPDAEVRIQRDVRARSDEAAAQVLKGLRIEEEVSATRVKVESRRTEQMRGFRQNVRLEYRVNVPAGLNLSFTSENGSVRMENVQGRIVASATNGMVTGRRLSGAIEVTMVNGGIQLDVAAVTGDIKLSAVNGGIRLFMPKDANATLEATAVNGGITIQEGLPLKTTTRDRLRVSGTINAGGPKIELQVTNGPIRLGPTGPAEPAEMEQQLRERRGP